MIQWGELKNNPLDGVEKPQPNYKEIQTWTREEAQKFLKIAKEYQAYMAYWLALNFGLQFSEVLGLEWKNIDFTNRLLHVRQAYHDLVFNPPIFISISWYACLLLHVRQAYHEIEMKIGGLKTRSAYRTLPISEQQFKTLKEHKESQKPNISLVVSTKDGNFMMKRNIRHSMKRICERAGVKLITFHELRHTHATLL